MNPQGKSARYMQNPAEKDSRADHTFQLCVQRVLARKRCRDDVALVGSCQQIFNISLEFTSTYRGGTHCVDRVPDSACTGME